MKSPVQLYLRVRLPDGTYPYLKAAFAANGRLRPHHAIHAGRAAEFSGSTYYLRYRIGEKRVWKPVGNDPTLALTRLQQKVRDLQHVDDDADDIVPQVVAHPAASTPLPAPQLKPPLLLNDAIKDYLAEVKIHKSAKTFAAYRKTLYLFSPDAAKEAGKSPAKITRQFANKPLCEVSRKDLLSYAQFLKAEQGSVPRTVRNRIDFFQIFLHHYGVPSVLKGKDLPQYTEKKARAYNPSQLAKLFAEATQDEADLLHFFLCTGAREQEAKFVCWTDVDLQLKTYTVTEHLDLGYRPKDKEEGSLPIPDVLVRVLKARREWYPQTRLIFPGKRGKPNGHALRVIKRLAFRVGVNCGQCVNKRGKSCATHPVCRQFVLHKLRKTFATTLHHQGLSGSASVKESRLPRLRVMFTRAGCRACQQRRLLPFGSASLLGSLKLLWPGNSAYPGRVCTTT